VRNPLAFPLFGGEQAARPAPSPFAPLENGVRTAYAVVDDYLRRGQIAAFGIYNDSNRRDDMSDYRGNTGGYNPNNPLSMLAEQWLMAMRAWTQAWLALMPGAWQSPWPGASCGTQSSRLTVQVSSKRSADVSASLAPGVDACWLICDPLRQEPGSAQIDAPAINLDQGGVHVNVTVGDQPAGRYRGCIRRKADGNIAGEITVNLA